MVGDCNDDGIEAGCDLADRSNCDASEGTVEVPMLEPMGIACDDWVFISRNSRKPRLNENLRVAVCSSLIHFGGRVSLRLRKTRTIRINNRMMTP